MEESSRERLAYPKCNALPVAGQPRVVRDILHE